MSAEAEIKQFIDRVLRLKEEQDALSEDIREVYSEAKGRGHDKTVLGNVVAHIRKVERLGRDTLNEREAIFDLYLTAYETGGRAHAPARTREIIEQFSPETGEIPLPEMSEIMDMDTPKQPKAVKAKTNTQRPSNNDKSYPEAGPQAEASLAGTGTGTLADREGRHEGEAVLADLPTHSPETATECAAPEEDAAADERNVEATVEQRSSASDFTPPAFLTGAQKTMRDYRPHCQKPDSCAGSGLRHCYSCSKLIPAESEAA